MTSKEIKDLLRKNLDGILDSAYTAGFNAGLDSGVARSSLAINTTAEELIQCFRKQSRETGKWIKYCYQNFACSKCQYIVADSDVDEYRYCPKCGAFMTEVQNEEQIRASAPGDGCDSE